MSKGLKIFFTIIVLSIIALLIIITSGSEIYTDWLWFKNLDFSQTFLTMFFTNFYLRLAIGFAFTIFLFMNLYFTKKPLLEYLNVKNDDNIESIFNGNDNSFFKWLDKRKLNYLFLLGSIILGFMFSSISQDLWKIVLKYLNQSPFNSTDPIFSKDLSFYIFSLPFYNFLREMGMVLVVLSLIVIGIIYTIASGISSFNEMKFKLSKRAKNHITLLVILFLFLKAWGYRLSMYNILYSARGVVFGAGYTDVNANLIGLKILFYIAITIGLILLISLFKNNYKILIWGLGIWIFTSFIFGNIYPGFVQRYQVDPNEITKESKFINYNIEMTLKAYGLDRINKKIFNVKDELDPTVIANNQETINNIRLWDPRPLRSTYSQLQGLRPYYVFPGVDIDRYYINGEYRQVMLAARELDKGKLDRQAKTWINEKLKYTHGYGIVMSPVNMVTTEGLPEFFIKDIPPKTTVDIKIDNPAIYYGEKTNDYVITNTNSSEFDYPMGSKNKYIDYTGTGGVELSNFFLKGLYALRYGNIKFLLANDINNESRIMYYRNIKERVRKVAPFLSYDNDPYLVLSEGNLYWIQDAYTTTNKYPYSQPFSNLGNYIRNSVKVVIDAFNGTMNFYIIDKKDPLAITYQKIFPDLFIDGEEMPEDFRRHLRYPQDLFMIQSQLYSTYHMTDPTVFYNKEDLWNIPDENYAGSSISIRPYYINMELPGNNNTEFVLMQPFTPANKNNMVAWMAGRSDGEHYGELLVYTFPKDKLVYGPMQIESRIDQDADISQLLSLWGQRGSRVIRGNLLVIPIDNTIMYVEPVYLQAETSELPELKRVVVSYQNQVVMKETLSQALQTIFGQQQESPDKEIEEEDQQEDDTLTGTIEELSTRALDIYQKAKESLKEGQWAQYGEYIKQLEDILSKLKNTNKE